MSKKNKVTEEIYKPKDSERAQHEVPKTSKGSVRKAKDKTYNRKDAEIKNPALQREQSEQPVNPIKE